MAHPHLETKCPYANETLFINDEEGYPLFVEIVKATFQLSGQQLTVAEKQIPVNLAGEFYGDPETSCYKYEPETAFVKPSTDVVLIGNAHPRRANDRHVDVSLRVGDKLEKKVRVFGDRRWVKRMGIVDMTNPEPFEQIPLTYERAFGGWDAAEPNPLTSQFEPRNPTGCGFRRKEWSDEMLVPNLEDPHNLISVYGDTPEPAGFGFTSPNWQPRAALAGTYDEKWENERSPLLPTDFDTRFFNAASPGLISQEYLKGTESIAIENASPQGSVHFDLPAVPPPTIRVQLRGHSNVALDTNLDTLIINAEENLVFMLWRTKLRLRNGPHDVQAIEVG